MVRVGAIPGRARRDRGAAAVEAAIVLPLFLLLVFGMIELGALLRTYASTANGVRSAGRVASVAGADPMADQRILARLDEELESMGPAQLELVVIWHAAGPGEHVPAACVPADLSTPNGASLGVTDGGTDAVGACNAYVRPTAAGAAFDKAGGRTLQPPSYWFGCEGAADPLAAQKLDCRWPGKDRRAVTTPRGTPGPSEGPDFVGVYVRVDHHVSDRVFDRITITDAAISLIEPQGYDV